MWQKSNGLDFSNSGQYSTSVFFHFLKSFFTDMPEIMESDAPWLAWEAAAVENPTVVNTSVSSLANLFFDLPNVMDHMQKTIDFYIKNGQAPTLEELKRLHKSLDHPYPLVPGLQVSVVTIVTYKRTYWQKTVDFDFIGAA